MFLTSGTYYLVVDGEEGSCGPFRLVGEVAATLTTVPSTESASEPSLLLVVRPNPARGAIVFQAELPVRATGAGVLEIYSVAGARVWSEHVTADAIAHGITWDGQAGDGTALPSGIFLARLQVGAAMGQAKITITR